MEELRIGDKVQVVDGQGSLTYDEIYFFGHRDPASMGSYVKLTMTPRLATLALISFPEAQVFAIFFVCMLQSLQIGSKV